MIFDLPKLYAITDTQLSGLSHADQVARLAAGGATLIQLREKHLTSSAFYEAALPAIEVAHRLGAMVIINDRVDIAMALHADGVHLGQTDLTPDAARTLLGPKAIIGFSVHNVEQARRAMTLPVNYIAAGPIFLTTSKANPDPVLGLNGLSRIRKMIGAIPLVAIGGITGENAGAIFEAGADSVALISGLLSPPERIESTVRTVLSLPHPKSD